MFRSLAASNGSISRRCLRNVGTFNHYTVHKPYRKPQTKIFYELRRFVSGWIHINCDLTWVKNTVIRDMTPFCLVVTASHFLYHDDKGNRLPQNSTKLYGVIFRQTKRDCCHFQVYWAVANCVPTASQHDTRRDRKLRKFSSFGVRRLVTG